MSSRRAARSLGLGSVRRRRRSGRPGGTRAAAHSGARDGAAPRSPHCDGAAALAHGSGRGTGRRARALPGQQCRAACTIGVRALTRPVASVLSSRPKSQRTERPMQFAQRSDRVADGAAGPIDVQALPGTWRNSNPDSNGIARIVVSETGGDLSLQVFAIGQDGLIDWGPVSANVFTASPVSRVAAGFTCVYDFGFVETRLQGMIMKGLLVLAQLHRFKDQSGRADYFVREYFALAHARY